MENKYSDNPLVNHKFFAALRKINDDLVHASVPTPVIDKAVMVKLPPIKKMPALEAKMAEVVKEAEEKKAYLGQISCHMADLVAQVVRFGSLSRMEKEVLGNEIREYEKELMGHLAPEIKPNNGGRVPLFIWKARVAYAEAIIASATTRNALLDIIEGSKFQKPPCLIKLGVMEYQDTDTQGGKNVVLVKVFNQSYKINGSKNEAARLKELLETAVGRIKSANFAYYAQMKADLNKNATIDDPRRIYTYTGVKGSAVLDVPTIDGTGQKLPGGSMLVESNGDNILVVAAIGYFQKVMQEIADAGIAIPIESLKDERFNWKKGLSDQDNHRCQILHNMLRRAKTALDKNDAQKTRLTPAEEKEHEDTRKWVEEEKANQSPTS